MTTTEHTDTDEVASEYCEHGKELGVGAECAACEAPTEREMTTLLPCVRCSTPAHRGGICCQTCIHYDSRWNHQDGSPKL